MPVYVDAFNGCVSDFSDFWDKYSDAAIDKDAAIPVIKPARPTSLLFASANVSPANVPVSSTKASFNPKTMELVYFSLSSSIKSIKACSCSSSSSRISLASGKKVNQCLYLLCALSSLASISFNVKVMPNKMYMRV